MKNRSRRTSEKFGCFLFFSDKVLKFVLSSEKVGKNVLALLCLKPAATNNCNLRIIFVNKQE